MTKSHYRNSLDDARKELQELRALRQEVELRIARVEQTVLSLAALCNEPEEEVQVEGLTDACRRIFQALPERHDLTPTELREALQKSGFDLSRYDNPMAVIHTTIKRLKEQGQLTVVLHGENKGYRWTQNDPSALDALRRAGRGSAVFEFLDDFARKRA